MAYGGYKMPDVRCKMPGGGIKISNAGVTKCGEKTSHGVTETTENLNFIFLRVLCVSLLKKVSVSQRC